MLVLELAAHRHGRGAVSAVGKMRGVEMGADGTGWRYSDKKGSELTGSGAFSRTRQNEVEMVDVLGGWRGEKKEEFGRQQRKVGLA